MIPDLSRSQQALRALVLLGPLVGMLATGPAGSWPAWWVLVPQLGLAVAAAVAPDSSFPAAAILLAMTWWTVTLRDGLHPMVLVAAPALLLTHLAAMLASYGPGAMPLDGPTLRLWARRGALVLVTVPAVWGAARLLRGEPEQPGIWMIGVAAACAATVVAGVALTAGRED